jgi:V/A-type H+-transporting ATPase subunit F
MGRLMVITTSDLAPGFQLAGVETFAVESIGEAEATLRKLLTEGEASLVVVRRALLQAMDVRLQRQAEASYQPVVMPIPGAMPVLARGEHRRYIAALIRRAIGFQITFGTEEGTGSK